MTGRRPFEELTKGLSLKRQAPIAARVSQLKADVPLHELRPAPERLQEGIPHNWHQRTAVPPQVIVIVEGTSARNRA
ncbi:MAG: hypothetical protein QOD11_129 [Bradyrhizobium sp.]|jgi:hypothetical protein|nr:hypothetical protein [Bradyrhizobium sp.]